MKPIAKAKTTHITNKYQWVKAININSLISKFGSSFFFCNMFGLFFFCIGLTVFMVERLVAYFLETPKRLYKVTPRVTMEMTVE